MKTNLIIGLISILGFIFLGCQTNKESSFNEELEKNKILEMYELNKQFLRTLDVSIIRKMDSCSDIDSSISIMRGDITYDKSYKLQTDEEILASFGKIPATKVEDLTPPIIHFSPDGKMAYVVGKIEIIYEPTDRLGNKINKKLIDAFLNVWEKHGDCWNEVALAQTLN